MNLMPKQVKVHLNITRMRLRVGVVLLLLLMLYFATFPKPTSGQAGTVGVLNVAPTFRYIELTKLDGLYAIRVVPYDGNGWGDITLVRVNITSQDNKDVSLVEFQQYNNSERVNRFVDLAGHWLVKERSSYAYTNETESGMNLCSIILTFILRPMDGAKINITAYDRAGLFAEHKGPFTLKMPSPFTYYIVPASFTIAMLFAIIMMYSRWKSNQMAKIIERGGFR